MNKPGAPMMGRWVAGLALLLATAVLIQAQSSQLQNPVKAVVPSEDDLLLLSLRLKSIPLTDNLEGYRNGGGVLLPLGEVSRLLEISVRTDPARGTAEGFVGRTDRTFSLDVAQHRIRYTGKDLVFDPSLVQVQKSDIYVDYRALNAWFSLGITFDERGSAILVDPKDPLPLQLRLQRENLAAQMRSASRGGYIDPGFARVPNPYAQLGVPAIDQSMSMNYSASVGLKASPYRYTAGWMGDVAGGSMNGFLDLESSAPATLNLSYGQKDPSAGLLGPFHATEATVGSVSSLGVPLVSESHSAMGMTIANGDLSGGQAIDSTVISDPLSPGWDVELYQDKTLADYQHESGNGRYEFRNIRLTIGTNRFRLVFNGPLGERREESVTRSVSDNLRPGALRYSLYAGGSERSPEGAVQTEIGLKQDLTAFTIINRESLATGSHDYATAGMRGYVDGALVTARVVEDPASGHAGQVDGQWNWGRALVDLSQTAISGLTSNVYGPQLDPQRDETRLRLGNLTMPAWSGLTPSDLEFSHEDTTQGSQEWLARGRVSYQSHGLSLTNWSSWQSQTGVKDQRMGEFLLSDWKGGRFLQGRIGYEYQNSPTIQSLMIQTGCVLRDLRVVTLGLYQSPTDGNFGLNATLTRNTGAYAYGLAADLSTKHGLIVGLNLSFGAIRNPATGRWESSAQAQTTRGAVLVHVFLDTNGTGKFDPKEASVAGVAVFVNDSSFDKVTGKDGRLLVDGLAANRPADIRISDSSLDNPLLVCSVPGLRVYPRPGKIQEIYLPIVATAEVTGTVYLREDGEIRPGAGVLVEVVGPGNRVVQHQRAAYDGFYALTRVPVGKFVVRATVDGHSFSKEIVVPPAGAYIDGIDLVAKP